MESSLDYATTPLALASLVAILIVGLLKVITTGKDNALNRIITHYGFTLVLMFGVLGNAAYLYDTYQSSETLIIGTVVDKATGKYLPRAQIDTGGHARGMTSDTGDFVLAIPKSRITDEYQISASLDGYKRQITNISNSPKMFVRFELDEIRLDFDTAMQAADQRIVVGHFLGLPDIQMQIKFSNPLTSELVFKDLQAEVISPSGDNRRLVQISASMDSYSPALPPLPNVYVEPSETKQYLFRFIQYDNYTHQLVTQAQASLQSDPAFQRLGPQVNKNPMDEKLSETLVNSMHSSWFWEPGESIINVSANIDGKPVRFSRVVTLTSQKINDMKASEKYYRDGFGISHFANLVPVGAAVPGHQVESFAR